MRIRTSFALLAALSGAASAEETVISLVAGRSARVPVEWPVVGAALTDPAVADVQVLTPELVLALGKAPGTTDLVLWGEGGRTAQVRLDVDVDATRLSGELAALVPGSRLEIARSQGATIVSGTLARAEHAERLHQYFDAQGLPFVDATSLAGAQQVQVQVRLAEVSRNRLRQLGLNVLKAQDDFFGGLTLGPSIGGPIQPVSIGATLGTSALGDVPFSFTQAVNVSSGVTLFAGFPNADIEFFVQALQENDYLRILAEPNLVSLSGEEASFLAGGEFPIPVVQGTGGGTSITIEYKEFGVKLRFRPVVLGDGTIRLRVFTEVSDLSDIGAVEIQGFQVPSVVTRNAETTVEMKSGQTFALAGLLNQRTTSRISEVPGLADIPILGTLFRSTRFKSGETEMLLLVTTGLVEPLNLTDVPTLPGEDAPLPTDWELYVEGQVEGARPPAVTQEDALWLQELGLAELRGPGGWASHDQAPVASVARPESLE